MRKISLWAIPLLLLLLSTPLHAEEAPAEANQTQYPGVAQVVPRTAQLEDEAALANKRIGALGETDPMRERLDLARQRLTDMEKKMVELSGPLGWGFGQMLDLRDQLTDEKASVDEILERVSVHLADLDDTGKRWGEKKTYWQGWQDFLQHQGAGVPSGEFRGALSAIGGVLRQVAETSAGLVLLQKEAAELQGRTTELLARVDDVMRQQTFRKVSHSFASRDYLRQFDAALWSQVRDGIAQVGGISVSFLRNQAWIIILQALLVLILGGFIIHHRPQAEETEEWRFILGHPWATGIFVSFSALSFLYTGASELWMLLLWALAAISASILICALLKNPRKRFTVWLLTILFLLSLVLRAIVLPLPLYRLYLALVSLVGVPLFLSLAASNQRAHEGRLTGFTISLRIGAAILLISFMAQFGGYSTLSYRLIESSLKTVFLGLFAAMVIKLGQGGIDFILSQKFFRRWRFFRRFGDELADRLDTAFVTLVTAYAGLYLLEVWYIYDSVAEAWNDLLGLGFTIEEVHVTVQKVLVIFLVLYVSIVVSWVIRSVLEAEFFPRRRFDRGVRDSIKKLLHYSLVFLGFLVAMTMAGVELKNFTVLAGAFGIGIGFGLQNIVNNFVSGIILLFERPVKVGDMVIVDEEWGTVRKIGLRSTVVTTLEESEIIVPNSLLVSEKVTNWSLTSTLCRISIPVGVAYGSDVPLVLEILEQAGHQDPSVLDDPAPSPIFRGFGDSSLDFELRVWISDVRDRIRVRSEICQFIDRRFREEGVEIPFPQRDLHLRSIDSKIIREVGKRGGLGPSPAVVGAGRGKSQEGRKETKSEKAAPKRKGSGSEET